MQDFKRFTRHKGKNSVEKEVILSNTQGGVVCRLLYLSKFGGNRVHTNAHWP